MANPAVPLTIFDEFFPDNCFQNPMVYVARSPMPPLLTLKQGLADALNYFPHLAGRLAVHGGGSHRRRSIVLNNTCIPVVEASFDAEVRELLPACPSPRMAVLHPPVNEVVEEQFNRLKCGGMAIVLAVHRQVADGQCTSSFLRAWS